MTDRPILPRARRARWLGASALAAPLLLSLATAAHGQELPSGGVVAAGSASIQSGADALTVRQGSARAVIDWRSFDIGAGKTVTFRQPGAGAAILNRVRGPDASRIAGALKADGQVFLINPKGLVITSTGVIDTVGGFVGSTLDIRNEDFLAGRLVFQGQGGAILNQGHIIAGQAAAVALIGGRVDNEGIISAPLGRVAIGSGQRATLDLSGDGFLQVALPPDLIDADGRALISNSGVISADGGQVVITAAAASRLVRQTVNMSGVISARSLSGRDGAVLLDGGEDGDVTVSGSIFTDGPLTGGRIDLTTGGDLSLSGATLSATGAQRGGLVRIGGAFQGGQTPQAVNAAQLERFSGRFGELAPLRAALGTTIDAASVVDVSSAGEGGTAVVWSQDTTHQYGRIRAGGAGAVEISSLSRLSADLSQVDAGAGGMVLLDPHDIVVDDLGADPTTGTVDYLSSPSTDNNFGSAALIALLEAGTDVILHANNDIDWSLTTPMFIAAAHPGDIYLSAGRSVMLTGDFGLNASSLTVVANDATAVAANRDAGAANIDAFGAQFGATSGDVSLTMGSGGQAGVIGVGQIQARNVTISTGGEAGSSIRITSLGDNTIAALGAVTLTGPMTVNLPGTATFQGATVTWTDEATSTLSGPAFEIGMGASATKIKFIENGTLVRYGALDYDANNIRLALGAGGSSPQYSRAYGASDPAFATLHVVSGSLHSGDTLGALLAASSTSQSSTDTATSTPGDFTVTTSATASFDFAANKVGYFADLTTAVDTLRITKKVLTPTVSAASYVYGSPTAVVSLAGIINSDVVAPTASLSTGGSATLAASGGSYAFGQTAAPAGTPSYTLTGLAGTNAGNYSLDLSGTITATLTISKKSLTYAAVNATSTYGTLATPGFSFTGVLGTDVVSAGAITVTSGGSSTLSATTAAGTYVTSLASLGGAQGGNYSIAGSGNTTAQLVISPKALTFTVADLTSTYGTLAAPAGPVLTGIVGGDSVSASLVVKQGSTPVTLAARSPAGAYALTAGTLSGGSAANYVIAGSGNTNGTLTIDPKSLGFTVATASQTYGSQTTAVTLTGILSGDTVLPQVLDGGVTRTLASLGSGAYGFDAQSAAGAHSFSLTGLTGTDAANYSVSLGGGTSGALTVDQKALTYSIADLATTYGTAAAPQASLTGVVGADDVQAPVTAKRGGATVSLGARTPVGTYALIVSALTGAAATNYSIALTGNTDGVLVISPKAVTYSIIDVTATYGTLASLGSASLTGVVSGDTLTGAVVVSQGGSSVTLTSRSHAGAYALTVASLGGADAANYTIAGSGNTAGALTISPKSLTYSLGGYATTYGTAAAPVASLTGVLGGDSVSGVVAAQTGGNAPITLAARSAAGSYVLSLSGLTGTSGGDYAVAGSGNTAGSLVISPKTVTYVVPDLTSVYGDSITTPAGILNGVLSGDDATLQVQTGFATSHTGRVQAGSYAEHAIDIQGAAAANYVLAGSGNTDGTYTVTPRFLAVGVSFDPSTPTGAKTLTYGAFPGEVNTYANVEALVGDDVTGGGLSVTGGGNPLPLSTSGRIRAGSYTYAYTFLSGNDASNYTGSFQQATLTVTKATSAAQLNSISNTQYGDTPGFNFGVAGLSGDQLGLGGLTAAPSGGGAPVTVDGHQAPGRYVVTGALFNGADAGNYDPTFGGPVFSFTVSPRNIFYVTDNASSVYGTLADLGAASISGVVNGDDLTASPYIGGLSDRTGVGAYDIGIALAGSASANYVVAASGNTSGRLTISPKTLSYQVTQSPTATQNYHYGDLNQTVPVNLQGLLSGDVVSVTPIATVIGVLNPVSGGLGTVHAFDGPTPLPAGNYSLSMARSGGTYRLQGAQAGNYVLPDDGRLRLGFVNIGARLVSYNIASVATFYGDIAGVAVPFTNAVAGFGPSYSLTATRAGVAYNYDQGSANVRTPVGEYALSLAFTGASAYDYALFPGTSTNGVLTIAPRPISVTALNVSTTYGSGAPSMVLEENPLGDDIRPVIDWDQRPLTLAKTAGGYGLAFDKLYMNAGLHNFAVRGLAGADAGNYVLANPDVSGTVTVNRKALNFSVADVHGQYGGYLAGSCSSIACAEQAPPGLTTGAITLSGILDGDAVTGKVRLVDVVGDVSDYGERTPAGSYFQVVGLLQGSDAANYVIASSGNTAGIMTLDRRYVVPRIEGGGRLYNGADFTVVGTPGKVTMLEVLSGDDVTPLVALYGAKGPYTGAEPIPPGDYDLKVAQLVGRDAANYQIAPYASAVGFSRSASFTVEDVSVFNFGFLGLSDPSQTYTPPPTDASLFTTATTAGTTTYAGPTATGAKATAGAGAGASISADLGQATLTAMVGASTTSLASFGVQGVTVKASAKAMAELRLESGPVYVAVGADAQVGVKLSFATLTKSLQPGITLDAMAKAELYQTVGSKGEIGGGVDGNLSGTVSEFAMARSNNEMKIGLNSTKVEQDWFVGTGVSAGASGGLSGGGVEANCSATVYSPGSLFIGTRTDVGFEDHNIHLGFTMGISIGIGGFEIKPDLNISTAGLEGIGNAAAYAFGGGSSCDADCQAENRRQDSINKRNASNDAFWEIATKKETTATEMLAFMGQHPEIRDPNNALEQFKAKDRNELSTWIRKYDQYETAKLTMENTMIAEADLMTRLQANPGSLSQADILLARDLRKAEVEAVNRFANAGLKLSVADGKMSLVNK